MTHITRKISRETAEEWGLPHAENMNPLPLCPVCKEPVDWVECPTGGWWSHWVHPRDDHDATGEPPERNGLATFQSAEYQHSSRWTETWDVVFIDPDGEQVWSATYEEPSNENGEGEDPWDYAKEIELTLVTRQAVTVQKWRPVEKPDADGR